MDSNRSNAAGKAREQRTGHADPSIRIDSGNRGGKAGSGRYKTGFVDGEYQDAGVRGLVCVFGKRGSGKTTRARELIRGARRVVVWDPVACCGVLGFPVVTQPGQLRDVLAAAGKHGPVAVVYQPRGGDIISHWEHVGVMCVAAQNLILMADEVDMICGPGTSKNAASPYWKQHQRTPALETIVQFGRHSHIAFIAIARAPQDVWRRLTGQSLRILCFRMNETLELEALRSRLGSQTETLPNLREFQYLDWNDGGTVTVAGGRI